MSEITRQIQQAILYGRGIPTGQTQTGASATMLADSTQTVTGAKTYSANQTFNGSATFNSNLVKTWQVICQRAKVGATSGAVVNAADNKNSAARVPASQTAATIVFPIDGIPIGASITAFAIIGQIESGGNVCTVDAALRKQTTAAADLADAAVSSASITQVSVTADTALSAANAGKTGITETVGADETHYVLVTVTTALATDVDLQGVLVTYTTDYPTEA